MSTPSQRPISDLPIAGSDVTPLKPIPETNRTLAPLVNRAVLRRDIPWETVVTQADPLWRSTARNQVEFEFTGRTFRHDPLHRGAYADD